FTLSIVLSRAACCCILHHLCSHVASRRTISSVFFLNVQTIFLRKKWAKFSHKSLITYDRFIDSLLLVPEEAKKTAIDKDAFDIAAAATKARSRLIGATSLVGRRLSRSRSGSSSSHSSDSSTDSRKSERARSRSRSSRHRHHSRGRRSSRHRRSATSDRSRTRSRSDSRSTSSSASSLSGSGSDDSVSDKDRSRSRSLSIPRRHGSPSFLDRRRITRHR
ncbi:unnamed protein product, partial [Callosobruchus maculatus]